MNMVGRMIYALACVVILIGKADASALQSRKDSDWLDAVDDASRAELFDQHIRPANIATSNVSEQATIGLSIPKVFIFPQDTRYDSILKKSRVNAIFGIDISHYTDHIDLSTLRVHNVEFIYVKATQGVRTKDGKFAQFWDGLGKLPPSEKVYRGAYHFLSSQGSGVDQANSFLALMNLHGGLKSDDLPPCLDMEWDRTSSSADEWKGRDPKEIIQIARDWLETVQRSTGRTPVIYTARAWWHDVGLSEDNMRLFASYRLWIADYSTSHKATESPMTIGGAKQDLWQFASDSYLSNVSAVSRFDSSIYYGTDAQFLIDFGISQNINR